ncbi:MAG: hypothetical protein M5U14_01750 [Acidimicrobiia bacterium]|nr:hypothetical protein [Acidimicrobiia bacterium]
MRRGQPVARGEPVGRAGGRGPGHEAGRLHLGLRVGDRYLDPMLLFGPPDLAPVVRLAPVEHDAPLAAPAAERRSLALALDLGAVAPPAGLLGGTPATPWDLVGRAAGFLVDGTRRASALAGRALDVVARAGRGLVGRLVELGLAVWARTELARMVDDLVQVAQGLGRWLRDRLDCTQDAPAADGTGGSTHLLFAVAGIDSRAGPDGRSLDLPVEDLGYRAGEVAYFSYAAGGGPYTAEDTHGDLLVAAARLGEQLRAFAAEHPGREVDLVAHSQGGVVVRLFLEHVYDAGDPSWPPLGTVVTLSSPHEGAPAATAVRRVAATRTGRAVLDAVGSRLGVAPADAPSVAQLDERSPLTAGDAPLPEHVELTSVGAVDDLVVPATNVEVPGARVVVVDPEGWNDHGGVVDSPRSMQEVRLALEGRPPACQGLVDGLRQAVEPVIIRAAEREAGIQVSRAMTLLDWLTVPLG